MVVSLNGSDSSSSSSSLHAWQAAQNQDATLGFPTATIEQDLQEDIVVVATDISDVPSLAFSSPLAWRNPEVPSNAVESMCAPSPTR